MRYDCWYFFFRDMKEYGYIDSIPSAIQQYHSRHSNPYSVEMMYDTFKFFLTLVQQTFSLIRGPIIRSFLCYHPELIKGYIFYLPRIGYHVISQLPQRYWTDDILVKNYNAIMSVTSLVKFLRKNDNNVELHYLIL